MTNSYLDVVHTFTDSPDDWECQRWDIALMLGRAVGSVNSPTNVLLGI